MTALSRQDMQTMLDTFRSRLLDQVASKQDVQRTTDAARDRVISYMHDYLQQNQQQFVRQLDMRTKMYRDRMLALESRICTLEQELKISRQLMEQMSLRQRNVVIPSVQEVASRENLVAQPAQPPQPSQPQQSYEPALNPQVLYG